VERRAVLAAVKAKPAPRALRGLDRGCARPASGPGRDGETALFQPNRETGFGLARDGWEGLR
ncbi:MAG TPA: hypothetical protein VE684_15885, partial [Crenalkalicoccus sp.]|nr:hypothetical protein [Crenalkalicoccus sp.]